MPTLRHAVAVLALALAAGGCVPAAYSSTAPGRFEGELMLRWVAPDTFVHVPNPDAPFRFVRANGAVIEPGAFVTDGGSVPRALWPVDGLSPWGYAPAFVVHDWLFQQHRCGPSPLDAGSFGESVTVMAEALRTLIGPTPSAIERERFAEIVAATASPVARRRWDHAPCRAVPVPW